MMDNNEEFIKALGDPLYSRIREALYGIKESQADMDAKELEQGVNVPPDEDLIEIKQDETQDVSEEDNINYLTHNYTSTNEVSDNSKAYGEIEEADCEETELIEEDKDKMVNDIPIEGVNTTNSLKGKSNAHISLEVEQALETLEKAISLVREYGFRSPSHNFVGGKEPPGMKKDNIDDSRSPQIDQPCLNNDASIEVSSKDIQEGTSREALGTNSHIPSLRLLCYFSRFYIIPYGL